MTTNVFDGVGGVIAADTRWSQQFGNYLIYLDEPLYPKIDFVDELYAFVFAGFGPAIQAWKDWIKVADQAGDFDFSTQPSTDGISICIVDLESKQAEFTERQVIKKNDHCFAGSGASYAYPCWLANGSARQSVETAARLDLATGGEVHYFDLNSKDHNFGKTMGARNLRIEDVSREASKRGMVMSISKGTSPDGAPFPLAQLAASNDAFKDIQAKLADGSALPDAPCAKMYTEWTESEKSQLSAALHRVADKLRKKRSK